MLITWLVVSVPSLKDDDFNSVRGILCQGHTDWQTQTQTHTQSRLHYFFHSRLKTEHKSEDIPRDLFIAPQWVAPSWDTARNASYNPPSFPKQVAPTWVPPFGWDGFSNTPFGTELPRAHRPRAGLPDNVPADY